VASREKRNESLNKEQIRIRTIQLFEIEKFTVKISQKKSVISTFLNFQKTLREPLFPLRTSGFPDQRFLSS
jgi:hypothetical protein